MTHLEGDPPVVWVEGVAIIVAILIVVSLLPHPSPSPSSYHTLCVNVLLPGVPETSPTIRTSVTWMGLDTDVLSRLESHWFHCQ
jgi:hypothetical protein